MKKLICHIALILTFPICSFSFSSGIDICLRGTGVNVNAELIVENSSGQKTGRDPYKDIYFNEINHSNYGDELDYRGDEELTVPNIIIDPAVSDTYIVRILGTDDDFYELKVSTGRRIGKYYDTNVFRFTDTIRSGIIKEYRLFYPVDSTKNVTVEEIVPNLQIKLVNCQNQLLLGGILQYYESGWKYAEDHGDGTYSVNSELPAVKLKMTYAHGIQEMSNVSTKANAVIFKTINVGIQLMNSLGTAIDTGTVQYYAGEWHDFGITAGGLARKELLPSNYKFRMTYAHGTNEKYQDVGLDSLVIFRTVPAAVELRNSQSALTDTGVVKYYSGAWYHFGSTTGGVAALELLPNNYKFRMTYAKGSSEKYQDIGVNPTVLFQTINVKVELLNSQGNPMDEGLVQYYAGAWYNMGKTAGGIAAMELLPYNYKFRMSHAGGSNEKYQDIGANSTVVFQAKNARVELRNSQGNLMDEGKVQYYSGAWYNLGTTSGGVAEMELLPMNYKFRMTYAKGSNEKYQDLGTNPTVIFQTIDAKAELRNSLGDLMDEGSVQYYSGAWYNFGLTSGGIAAMELLPYNYKFRMTYEKGSNEKYQDIGVNATVRFSTVRATVKVNNAQDQPLSNADVKYYAGAWYPFGSTLNGIARKELLPFNYKFRAISGGLSSEKYQDLSVNPVVEFKLNVP